VPRIGQERILSVRQKQFAAGAYQLHYFSGRQPRMRAQVRKATTHADCAGLVAAAAPALNRMDRHMNDEKIPVRVTSSGQTLEVVVLNKRLDVIQIVLGEGVHNVRCDLMPTRNGLAYVGNAMGREIVYERSREDVKADLARAAGFHDYKR
jgi:hypothetical protein